MPAASPPADSRRGLLAGIGCFVVWGLVAVYWKLLKHVDPGELVAHRTIWSVLFLLLVLQRRGRLGEVWAAFADRRRFGINLLSGALLMTNWLAFIWTVVAGHVLESSLGYFLVPLFHVAVALLFLRERLRPLQQVAVALAVVGVVWLLVAAESLPWSVFVLTLSWGLYGIVRKKSPMGAIDGLAVESLLFAPAALGYLVYRGVRGEGALFAVSATDHVLLLCSGWVTAVPLVWFGYAAARIRLSTLGLLQYISPSLQFLVGLAYGERCISMAAYVWIWLGLCAYSLDGVLASRRSARPES